ncbi:MAG: SRPBCC family protein [candidate division KSB1 bacterium]|nr:SRPBCC family protein [candidate division KSB1 bacterium]
MKVLKIIGMILLALIVIIAVLSLIAPKSFQVDRTITIDAPRPLVFSHVKFWRNWQAWSPWARMDSSMQVSVAGVDGTVQSTYSWNSTTVGSGAMTNTGLKENEEIAYHLHFKEPWESHADGYVRLADAEGKTQVTWGFYGKSPIPWNSLSLFMSMDKMVGKDFEQGLVLLKQICEDEYTAVKKYSVREVPFPATTYAIIQKQLSFDELQSFFAQSYAAIMQMLTKNRVPMAGAPAALYYEWDEQHRTTNVAAAIPLRIKVRPKAIPIIELPATTGYVVDYYGPYEQLGPAHIACDLYLSQKGLQLQPPVIEEYLTDPQSEPDSAKWLTRIYYFGK